MNIQVSIQQKTSRATRKPCLASPARPKVLASLLVALMIMATSQPAVAIQATSNAAASSEDPDSFSGIFQRANNLYEAFDQNGLNPVVKQQFMLEYARAFYMVPGKIVPSKLHHEISQLTSDAEIEKWLSEKWNQAAALPGSNSLTGSLRDAISNRVLQRLDPRAHFVTAKNSRVNKQLAENQYVGIGIRVRWVDDKALIDDPFPGGAALKGGARPNDFILQVDGQSMAGLGLGEIVDILRGPEGSELSVVLQNKDGSEPRSLNMVRTVVPIPSIHGIHRNDDGSWRYLSDKNPVFAYMKVDQIVGSSSAELKDAAQTVIAKDARGVILDLRQVTNADLHHATLVADVLCADTEFGRLESRDKKTRTLVLRNHSDFDGLNIAVLSPDSNVTGPVLALLAVLKKRPGTTVIGSEIRSDLSCLASFDLPGHGGAIGDLAFARLIPNLEGAKHENQVVQGHNVATLAMQMEFSPDHLESGKEQAVAAARRWLSKQAEQDLPN